MKTDKKDSTTLIAASITIVILITVIIIFFTIKKPREEAFDLKKEEKRIENENEKIEITFSDPKDVSNAINKTSYLIVDTRDGNDFSKNHIESSINIPLNQLLSQEDKLNSTKTIILVENEETQEGKLATQSLKNKGYSINYLKGGLYNYLLSGYDLISYGDPSSSEDRAKVTPIDLTELGKKLQAGERIAYLDVRRKNDFNSDHFKNAINIPLELLEKEKKTIPNKKLLIIDEDPKRSFQAAVRIYDMNVSTSYYLTNTYTEFKEAIKNKTLFLN